MPSPMKRSLSAAVPAAVLASLLLTGCTDNVKPSADSGAIQVKSTADTCELSTTKTQSGPVTFTIKNEGTQVTEFYLLAEDGLRIIGEVENIGPA